MPIDAVVADANALLSAALGHAASRVFTEYRVAVHAARYNADEVESYLPVLAAKYAVAPELLALQWRLLPVRLHEATSYTGALAAARARVATTDPDDVHPLALAMTLGLPLWSNDDDLAAAGVTRYTTAQLLAALGGRRPPKR